MTYGNAGERLKLDVVLYRYRMAAHLAIYVLGFTAPWGRWLDLDGRQKVWLAIAAWPARNGWMSFSNATIGVLAVGIVCATAGAVLRVYGSSHRGGVVVSGIGMWLHTLALAILMPPSGAIFTVVSISGLELFLRRPALALPDTPLTWGQALLAEVYTVGVAISFAIFGWRYNAFLLTKCVLVCFGVSLVARAFARRAPSPR
jgi:hypothetical protein